MKECLRIFCIILLPFALISCKGKKTASKVLSQKKINYVDVKVLPGMSWPKDYQVQQYFTQEELKENIENLCYILETSYSGYDNIVKRGFDSKKLKKTIYEQCEGNDSISSNDVADFVASYIGEYTKDSAFCITANSNRYFISGHATVFYSDVFVKKDGENYTVLSANGNENLVGKKFTGDKNNLLPYFAKGDEVYRVGYLSESYMTEMRSSFDGERIMIKVHAYNPSSPLEEIGETEAVTNDSAYIRVPSFGLDEDSSINKSTTETALHNFMTAGKRFVSKKNIVLDLRGTSGSDNTYSKTFLYNLLRNDEITSSATGEAMLNNLLPMEACYNTCNSPNNAKFWAEYSSLMGFEDYEIQNYEQKYKTLLKSSVRQVKSSCNILSSEYENEFNGHLYIITDSNTSTAAESTILFAEYLLGPTKQITVIGENTFGCVAYEKECSYQLSEYGLVLKCGMEDWSEAFESLKNYGGEGIGLMPDVWCTKDDLNETLLKVIQDEELQQYIK